MGHHRIWGATATLLAAGLAPVTLSGSPAAASSSCVASTVVLPDLGFGGGALAFNRTTIVGFVLRADDSPEAVYWQDGVLHRIGDTFASSQAWDINAGGDILGWANNESLAWVRHPDGTITYLRNDPPDASGAGSIVARRINESGQIAGSVNTFTNAARWGSASAAPDPLAPAPGFDVSESRGLNDLGQVAGDSDFFDQVFGIVPQATVWNADDSAHLLTGLFDGAAPGMQSASEAVVINDQGMAAGDSLSANADFSQFQDEATVWQPDGTPVGLGYLPGTQYSAAFGLSAGGRASGTSFSDTDLHAFVWSQGTGMMALPVPGAASYAAGESAAHKIGGHRVVGQSAPSSSQPLRPTVWNCPFASAFLPTFSRAATTPSEAVRREVWQRGGAPVGARVADVRLGER